MGDRTQMFDMFDEEGMWDLEGDLFSAPRGHAVCRNCNKRSLHWEKTDGGKWRLYDGANVHQCTVKPLPEHKKKDSNMPNVFERLNRYLDEESADLAGCLEHVFPQDYAVLKSLDLKLTGLLRLIQEARDSLDAESHDSNTTDNPPSDSDSPVLFLDSSWFADPLPEVYIRVSDTEITVSDPDSAKAAYIASNRFEWLLNTEPAKRAQLNGDLRARMKVGS